MAGERQHYIPKFLQKGFASRVHSPKKGKKKYYTWYFLEGNYPDEKNIDKIGCEKHFYGKQGDEELDKAITSYENSCALLLDKLRGNGGNIDIYSQKICGAISHLILRTKYARLAIEDMVEFVHRVFSKVFTDEKMLVLAINKWRNNNQDQFNKMIVEEIISGAPSGATEAQVRYAINVALSIDFTKELHLSQYGELFLSGLIVKQSEISRGAHLKALKNNILSEPRIDHFMTMKWSIKTNKSCNLILGDVGPIAHLYNNEVSSLYNIHKDEIKYIYLPISSCDLIVGTCENEPIHTFDQVNIASAKLSRHSFISAQHTKKEDEYSQIISQENPLIR